MTDGFIQIRIDIDDDSVLAPHFGNDFFDSRRPRRGLSRQFNNPKPHFFASGENGEGHIWMGD